MKRPDAAWSHSETAFDAPRSDYQQSIFALGNGYLGMRGDFEEGYLGELLDTGTFINGFYESAPIQYGEIAYGYPENGQTMLNVANARELRLWADGEPVFVSAQAADYDRTLSLDEALLRRSYRWNSPSGKRIAVRFERMVSLSRKHVAAIRCTVRCEGDGCVLRLQAGVNGDVANGSGADDPRVRNGLNRQSLTTVRCECGETDCVIEQKTARSGLFVACAAVLAIDGAPSGRERIRQSDYAGWTVTASLGRGDVLTTTKFISYVDSRAVPRDRLAEESLRIAREAAADGFDALAAEQREKARRFWACADIDIRGDERARQGMRFNLFALMQAAVDDAPGSIPAKGLTGLGYEGHYFWDSETYMLPFYLYTQPAVARNMLAYRHSILPAARRRAREMGHAKGALFAWRTINGDECSAYYPAGTAQYHINADIAHAVKQYVMATNDVAFLADMGAEILFETARLWAVLGFFNPRRDGRFCINRVTGPDEYSAIVDNNCYTNIMAMENLLSAVWAAQTLQHEVPERYAALAEALALSDDEIAQWDDIAKRMYIPQEGLLYLQDDGFLDREPWNLAETPKEHFPLLLHYHPLTIYRHRVCKQADLILAMTTLKSCFTQEEKRHNYSFYKELTTHDSSLSTSVFSILASDLGMREEAYAMFEKTLYMDLMDIQGNTRDGIHMANIAGNWMSIVMGFAGMSLERDGLRFQPLLPPGWQGYAFHVRYRDRLLFVEKDEGSTRYRLEEGDALTLTHRDQKLVVGRGESVAVGD